MLGLRVIGAVHLDRGRIVIDGDVNRAAQGHGDAKGGTATASKRVDNQFVRLHCTLPNATSAATNTADSSRRRFTVPINPNCFNSEQRALTLWSGTPKCSATSFAVAPSQPRL